MSRRQEISVEEQKELDKLLEETIEEAKNVKSDYKENPSELSGSYIQVNEDSPYLDSQYEGEHWKRVLKGDPKKIMEFMNEHNKNVKKHEKALGKKKKR